MEWKRPVIFISSTFNDMHAERDYLIKEVFPELNEWCEKRKIRLTDVDLRWGVKEEDTENNATVGTCLRHIDKSRPFFLCFLGQRRGWVPDFNEDINKDTKDSYPLINELIKNKDIDKSVTEMEIEHSLLSPMYRIIKGEQRTCYPTKHTLFFFRNPDYLSKLTPAQKEIYTNVTADDPDHADEKLAEMKEKIIEKVELEKKLNNNRNDDDKIFIEITDYKGDWDEKLELQELSHFDRGESKGRLTNFMCGEKSLKEILIKQLKEQFKIAYPDNIEIQDESELEKDINQQEIFCYLNSEGYIERPAYSEKLNNYVNDANENKICLLTSEAGYGKTMLLAKFSIDFEDKNNDVKLYKRFCGASNLSSDVYTLWKSIIDEAKISEDFEFYPSNIEDLKRNMSEILEEISKNKSLIIIDAVNQIENGIDMLKWFDELPNNLKLIISIKEDKKDENYTFELDKIKNRNYISKTYSFEIEKLDDAGKKELIKAYLKNYLKELDDEEIDEICKFEGSKNPLFLKILLAELRVFGSFDQLKDKIKSFGNSPLTAFSHVLERLENDEKNNEGENIVPLIFSLIAYARFGLSEHELVDIIKDKTSVSEKTIKDTIRIFIRQVRPFMAIKEGRHDFFYESFKLAARDRYHESKKELNELLAEYFKKESDPNNDFTFKGDEIRHFNELPYHLFECEDADTLTKTLSSYAFIKNKLNLSDIHNVVSDYKLYNPSKKEDSAVELIGRALELSSPVLKDDKNQLPSQLQGRMCEIDDSIVQDVIKELEENTNDKWLKSTTNALYSPKSSIIKRIKAEGKIATALAFTSDHKLIIGTDDGKLNIYRMNEDYLEVISSEEGEIIRIILKNNDKEMFVASKNGIIKKWSITDKKVLKTFKIETEITDIYISNTYEKIYVSSHNGIYSVDLKTEEIKKENDSEKNYNHILVPKRNETIFVCDEKEIDGLNIYNMKKAYNQHHQHDIGEDEGEGSFATKMDFTGDIKFIGLNNRFLTSISENGQMKFWNTQKKSESGQSIDEEFTNSLNDKFACAITLEDEKKIITLSEMGVLKEWAIPEPKTSEFRNILEIQTGIKSPSCIEYYVNNDDRWVIIGNKNNDITIVDLNKKIEEIKHSKHSESVVSLNISNNNIISSSENGDIYLWDINEENVKKEVSNDFRNNCVSFNMKESKLVSAGIKYEKYGTKINKISTWKINDEMPEEYRTNSNPIIGITQDENDIIFIEKNKLVIGDENIEFEDNAIALCAKLDSPEIFIAFEDGKLVKYTDHLNDFAFSIKSPVTVIEIINNKLIVGHENGNIAVFDLEGNHLIDLKHKKAITSICMMNEDEIISVSEDSVLKIWSLESGECIYTYLLDIYATAINVVDDKIILGDALGNIRFFNFENF